MHNNFGPHASARDADELALTQRQFGRVVFLQVLDPEESQRLPDQLGWARRPRSQEVAGNPPCGCSFSSDTEVLSNGQVLEQFQ